MRSHSFGFISVCKADDRIRKRCNETHSASAALRFVPSCCNRRCRTSFAFAREYYSTLPFITHAGEKGCKSKNDQDQLELSKGHCKGSQCSLKNSNCTVNMFVST